MSEWSAGYVEEVEYTYGYYGELNPGRMILPFLNYGVEFPNVETACELGFGQGISTNFHAAAAATKWYGNDFNPSQAAFAREFSNGLANRPELTDESFEEFCARPDLPNFDFIALHGIWSWISDKNRNVIVDFIRRKLNVGGVLYISYNTLPGWAGFSPMRHLLTEHATYYGKKADGLEKRIAEAIGYGKKLFDVNSKYTEQTFGAKERFERLESHDRKYLAHEYFNRDWQPMYFKDMYNWLSPAKLEFICSANYSDAIDSINLTEQQQAVLKDITDRNFKETVRDFLTNQQFRKDYWIKGKRNISAQEKLRKLKALTFIWSSGAVEAPQAITGALGKAQLQKEIYQAVTDIFSDRKPHSIEELVNVLDEKKMTIEMIMQAVFVLTSLGMVAIVPTKDLDKKNIEEVNRKVVDYSKSETKVNYLMSPVTGQAIAVTRFNQLFVEAIWNGLRKPDEWANHVCRILEKQNQKIVKDGKPLEKFEENLVELTNLANEFNKTDYPALKALGVI